MPCVSDGIPQPFQDWKRSLPLYPESEQRLDRWLFINGASVLLSEKPGELLTMTHDECPVAESDLAALLTERSREWGVEARILYRNRHSHKLLLFNRPRLQGILDEAPFCIMHEKLGYAGMLTVDGFLSELEQRWGESGEVPHEIGIALGYPLDDVFGYMGLLPLPCLGLCGWQVYGCMKESKRRSCAYNQARCRALAFIAA